MNDIIFAGSEGRKPLNIAEVTVTLDNSDHYLALIIVRLVSPVV